MDVSYQSPTEAAARLDAAMHAFDGRDRSVRAFALDADLGFGAVVDSGIGDDGVPFLWIGHWRERPDTARPPEIEVAAARSVEDLMRRRPLGEVLEGPQEDGPVVQFLDGARVPMRRFGSSGFRSTWVAEREGAAVALFARSGLASGVRVTEVVDAVPYITAWRGLVDHLRTNR